MKNKFFFSAMLASLLAFGLTISSCAPSAAKQAMLAAASVEEVNGLGNKLEWLQKNAQSGGTYVLDVKKHEDISTFSSTFSRIGSKLFYEGRDNITITLKGFPVFRAGTFNLKYDVDPIIYSSRNNTVFIVGSGVTLILDNIVIKGSGMEGRDIIPLGGAVIEVSSGGKLVMNEGSVITSVDKPSAAVNSEIGQYKINNSGGGVKVSSGGTLVMNEGSTIILNANMHGSGGGVCVFSGGTFIMKGGTITSNTSYPIDTNPGNVYSSEKRYIEMTQKTYKGGGVFVGETGTFIKSGGTITGYADNPEKGNVLKSFIEKNGNGGKVIQGNGHAIYFNAGQASKSIDTTVGPEMNFNFSNGTFSESRDE